MKINGRVGELAKLWDELAFNTRKDEQDTEVKPQNIEKCLVEYEISQIKNVSGPKILEKPIVSFRNNNFESNEENKNQEKQKYITSLPTEIIFLLSTKHRCIQAQNILKKTSFAILIESFFIDDLITRVNEFDLISIFRIVSWLCQKCGRSIWKNENNKDLSNLSAVTNVNKINDHPNSQGSVIDFHPEDKIVCNTGRHEKKLVKLAVNLNPLLKRRLMLFILHRGSISEFLINILFQFEGSVFEVLQKDLNDFP